MKLYQFFLIILLTGAEVQTANASDFESAISRWRRNCFGGMRAANDQSCNNDGEGEISKPFEKKVCLEKIEKDCVDSNPCKNIELKKKATLEELEEYCSADAVS